MSEETFYSQCGQDQWLDTQFHKRNGFCVEVGAYDGVIFSNSLFFEKYRNWRCMLIEPNDARFKDCQKNRPNALCYYGCAYNQTGLLQFRQSKGYTECLSGVEQDYDPRHLARMKGEISRYGGDFEIVERKSFRLQDLFDEHKIAQIDFITIDTEGCELKVLEGIDFTKTNITYVLVEDNYGNESLHRFLREKGYSHVHTSGDYIYVKS